MSTVVIEINDAGVRARSAAGELFDSPGYALIDGSVVTGEEARRQSRLQPGRVFNDFWGDLSLEALPAAAGRAATVADLAYHHLSQLWAQLAGDTERVILAVPGSYSREQLSLLLGIARECRMPVTGLVDMALVALDRPTPGRQLMHLELMLNRAVLTQLTQGRRLRRGAVSTIDSAGLTRFYDAWVNAIGDAFVRNTRYDPMHSADSEQQLYDQLRDWVDVVGESGSATVTLTAAEREHAVVVKSDRLAAAADDLYRQITRHIAASSRPGEPLTVLVTDRMRAFPGWHQALSAAVEHCDIVDLAPGAAAMGALRREKEIASGGETVAFVTSLAWDRATVSLPMPGASPPADSGAATHILYRGRGWPIADTPLYLGSQPHAGDRTIIMTGDVDGISRDHCRVFRRNGVVIVEDNSRHGTFLNDRRIDGEVQAQYGDVLRLGNSDQILQLISVSD